MVPAPSHPLSHKGFTKVPMLNRHGARPFRLEASPTSSLLPWASGIVSAAAAGAPKPAGVERETKAPWFRSRMTLSSGLFPSVAGCCGSGCSGSGCCASCSPFKQDPPAEQKRSTRPSVTHPPQPESPLLLLLLLLLLLPLLRFLTVAGQFCVRPLVCA